VSRPRATGAATKEDLDERLEELRQSMRKPDVQSIRWLVGTLLVYVVATLGAMCFILSHTR
jgi:hypothetical protein